MKAQYLLALDQGTTSSRALVFDRNANVVSIAQRDFRQIFPQPGWVEHDPLEIWSSQWSVLSEALANKSIKPAEVAAIGITNQRETTVVWHRNTGRPVYHAIVWQDRRTAPTMQALRNQGFEADIRHRTGLLPDAYFSASKVQWILNNVAGAREAADQGELAFGTVDTWLLWNLTGGKVHATDVSNASRTMLFNIHTRSWDANLLALFEIPDTMLPEVRSNAAVYGAVSDELLPGNVPVAALIGDQQSALFGQQCIEPGMAKTTYGTGCFLMLNTGNKVVTSQNNLLSTIAWEIDGKLTYALEGSVFIGGAAVQWLRDSLEVISHAADTEGLATGLDNNDGVYFVPALAGLGAPHWDPSARGAFFGLTRGTTVAHMARATLEAIAYQVCDVLDAMQKDVDTPIRQMRVDGGAANNNFLMQFQADILRCPVLRPKVTETTAMGAAFLAGLAVGFWKNLSEISDIWQTDRTFRPAMAQEVVEQYLRFWHKAVERSKNWIE
jgi:glycerol kinase